MKNEGIPYKVYKYRWIVLLVYIIITIIIQMQWLTFAPIARQARAFYSATPPEIDLLSEIYMYVFLVACIPAAYMINRFGIRIGIGIGAVLTGVFGLAKGVFGDSYSMVVASQIGLAVAQPFIINAVTKVAVHWFPINERATAVGLGTLAQFLGMIIVNIVTPFIVTVRVSGGVEQYDLQGMLMTYGMVSAVGALLLIVFLRENPPTPAGPEGDEERFLTIVGIKHILKHRDMLLTLLLFFIGLGIFNAIATCIDQISEIKGFTTDQSGMIMGLMLIAGVIGAIVVPPFSDKLRKRKPFLAGAIVLCVPGLIGMTFAEDYSFMLASAGFLGFFLLGAAAPIGFQYGAEVSFPAPESLSQGIILFVGQVSGIIFINGMNRLGMIPSMKIFIGLAVVNLFFSLLLRESPRMRPGGKE
jgi:FLVCR family MFS transporter 7